MLVSQSKTPLIKKYELFTRFRTQKIITFLEIKYGQNHGQCSEKGASAEADFWYGENIDHVKKKSSK